ncbi:TMEM175 family protein [Prauserella flavalba]|uniref:TMEM175 family protein n=1 Tax=Prauserella flavalba TaxID=1477506 RepID=UPI001AEFD4BE|nr:TMEM175 family protein [Prauserella flavalba]
MPADEGEAAAVQRQQLFTDAVVAIAITLLALGLPVPQGRTNADLLSSAGEHWDDYLAFGISFVVIFLRWSGHHRVFRHVVGTDRVVGVLTACWLFLMVLTPFATEVLSGDGAFQARFGFYAFIQAALSLIFLALVRHVKRAGHVRDGTPVRMFRHAVSGSAVTAVAFLVSIPVAFVTQWAFACWAAIPLFVRPVRRLWSRPV